MERYKQDRAFVSLLKICAKKKDIYEGILLHNDILKRGLLAKNAYVGSSLISMYAKCGMLMKAQKVLEDLPTRDMVCWSALISGYAQHGRGHDALVCFERMQSDGFYADVVTLVCVLKACSSIKAIRKGKQIHEEIVNRGLLKQDVMVGTALVDMYAKCGMLVSSQSVLEELLVRNVVSWNALISGYVQQGEYHDALNCFEQMQIEGLSPNVISFTCILKACGNTGCVDKGNNIHTEISDRGLLKKDIVLGTALVEMYAKCGVLEKAERVLEEISIRDVVAWNALLVGYAHHGQNNKTINSFGRMQNEGTCPDVITFICILKACGGIRAINKGKQIHTKIMSEGLVEKDIMLGSALVDMYAKCGVLERARKVLEELPLRNIVTWNALISGYAQQGQGHEALNCFEQMQSEGIAPDAVTFICTLKVCGEVGAIDKGKQIHTDTISRGLLKKDVVLGNVLVDMYCKCGRLEKAHEVLKELPMRDVVSWNALIAGFVSQGQSHEAMNCFEQMQNEGISPDPVTILCILKACSSIGAINKGKLIHDEIVNKGLLEKDVAIGTALVDMYAKCGMLTKAQELLEELPFRNMVSWSVLIAGYAEQRRGYEALKCFEQMQSEGFAPDRVTLLSVLSACSNSGLLDEAQTLFGNMAMEYGLSPSLHHHTCMVVILGSIGNFEKAMEVIKVMPSSDYLDIWLSLLGACQKWGNVKLGTLAFDQVLQLDNACAGAYVLIANIFETAGMQKDAEKIETMKVKYATGKQRN